MSKIWKVKQYDFKSCNLSFPVRELPLPGFILCAPLMGIIARDRMDQSSSRIGPDCYCRARLFLISLKPNPPSDAPCTFFFLQLYFLHCLSLIDELSPRFSNSSTTGLFMIFEPFLVYGYVSSLIRRGYCACPSGL